ncbi:hypothetical protein CERZMDRAFT_100679 [Cercospora zeae-maydis SCOH1-5]|uniref:F-box domain-containing protein n=1 Tax=Cercospora zeae-maydis SCOH1-5 TaxID=717836 RepID=A0A6A6F5P4_9PEZI|nr:hypothetical protein CERZMDRAFT_100679 [Cercospora zeae-maydis SCOH1-5]
MRTFSCKDAAAPAHYFSPTAATFSRMHDKESSPLVAIFPSTTSSSSEDSSMPPEQLVNLPIEIQLRILSQLSAKNIQCFRRVRRHFRDMIDLKENQSLLVGPGIGRSMDRLNAVVKRYCEFPVESEDGGPDAFLDAILDFISARQYGNVLIVTRMDPFSEFWIARANQHYGAGNPFGGLMLEDLTDAFVEMWQHAKSDAHSRHSVPIFDEAFGDKVEIMFPRIREFLARHGHHPAGKNQIRQLMYPKANPNCSAETEFRAREMANLHRAIGLPLLPAISPYSYYTTSQQNNSRLRHAIRREEEIKGIEKAALLEEIDIY